MVHELAPGKPFIAVQLQCLSIQTQTVPGPTMPMQKRGSLILLNALSLLRGGCKLGWAAFIAHVQSYVCAGCSA
jgi:hypothetical protein